MRRSGALGVATALAIGLLLPAAVPATATATGCGDQSGQLVQNCSFETGDWSSWTPANDTSTSSVVGTSGDITPSDGSYMLDAGPTAYGKLTQTLTTTPGAWYTASASWMGGDVADGSYLYGEITDTQPGAMYTYGFVQQYHTGYITQWTRGVYSFQAKGTSVTLSFRWVDPADHYYIDDVSVVPASPPSAPTITHLIVGDLYSGEVIVYWSAPSNTGMPPLNGFNVYVKPSGGSYGTTPANGTTPVWQSFDVSGLTNGQEYCFVVRAVSEVGEGTASAEQCAAPIGLPGAPTLTSLVPGPGQLTLNWTAGYLGQGLAGYDYYESLWNGTACNAFSGMPYWLTRDPSATSYTFYGLTAGQEYCFAIVPVDTNGYPGFTSNTLHAAPTAVPTSVTLAASSARVLVGEQVGYYATVTPAGTGTVTFYDGGTPISGCTAQWVNWGTAYCWPTYGTAGSHTITAKFNAGSGSGYLDSPVSSPMSELVTYGVRVLTQNLAVGAGSTVTFQMQLTDFAGNNLSASGLVVTVMGVRPVWGGTVDGTMTFVPASNKKPAYYSYALAVPSTAPLRDYHLAFKVTGDPVAHQDIVFTVTSPKKK